MAANVSFFSDYLICIVRQWKSVKQNAGEKKNGKKLQEKRTAVRREYQAKSVKLATSNQLQGRCKRCGEHAQNVRGEIIS